MYYVVQYVVWLLNVFKHFFEPKVKHCNALYNTNSIFIILTIKIKSSKIKKIPKNIIWHKIYEIYKIVFI